MGAGAAGWEQGLRGSLSLWPCLVPYPFVCLFVPSGTSRVVSVHRGWRGGALVHLGQTPTPYPLSSWLCLSCVLWGPLIRAVLGRG